MRPFINWARTVRSVPAAWVAPSTVGEVARALSAAEAAGRPVRVVGSGHSWSPLAATDGVALTLGGMRAVRAVDAERGRVTVEAGCTLAELDVVLARHGLSLPVLGSIAAQTVGGAIATATHGSSLAWGNLSSLVCGVEVVTPAGEVREVGADDPALDGYRVHLGALGVVTAVTLRVMPRPRLRELRFALPLDEAIARFQELARATPYGKLWWLPHTERAWWTSWTPTDAPPTDDRLARRLDGLLQVTTLPALLAAGGLAPALVPWVNRLVDVTYMNRRHRVGAPIDVLTLPMPPRHRETEVSVPLDRAPDLLAAFVDRVRRDRLRLDFILELRAVKADTGWMSPAGGRDSAQLGVYAARSPETTEAFLVAHELAARFQGRPHWGKELPLDLEAATARFARPKAFATLARAVDPGRVLAHPVLARVLDAADRCEDAADEEAAGHGLTGS